MSNKFLQKISTQSLTVLTTSVIVHVEQRTRQQTHSSGKGSGHMNINKFTQKSMEAVQRKAGI